MPFQLLIHGVSSNSILRALTFRWVEAIPVRHLAKHQPAKRSELCLRVGIFLTSLNLQLVVGALEVGTDDNRHLFGSNIWYGNFFQVEKIFLHQGPVDLASSCVDPRHN